VSLVHQPLVVLLRLLTPPVAPLAGLLVLARALRPAAVRARAPGA
jgi:hypothetical protein